MSNLYQAERTINQQQTFSYFKQVVKQNNLTFKYVYQNGKAQVAHLELSDTNNNLVSAGSGKGKNYTIGALAEAIEHYSLETAKESQVNMCNFKQVLAQAPFKKDSFMQSLSKYDNKTVATTTLKSNSTATTYQVPLSYLNPYFKNDRQDLSLELILNRYCSNLGTSIGLTFNDSYLHGLNESIERHYTALFYQQLIGIKQPISWSIYSSRTNKLFNEKKSFIQSKFGKQLTVITKSIYGPYIALSILVSYKDHKYSITPLGAGCSLLPQLALQRSIDELTQCLDLYSSEEEQEDTFALSVLQQYKGLKNLITISDTRIRQIATKKNMLLAASNSNSVTQQINLIERKLKFAGLTPLHRKLESLPGLDVLQVFIPGFDRFHLIRSGALVAPQTSFNKDNA